MLTKDQIQYLRGLVRVDKRKRERGLANAAPYPGQSEEEFEIFKRHLEEKICFIEATHTALQQMKPHAPVA